jgi:UPF0271 protein
MFLNLDGGERDDETEALWSLVDVLNCACGGHAGDAEAMDRAAVFSARTAVRLGAHPSYPDRSGFGRQSPLAERATAERRREVAAAVTQAVAAQCRELAGIARRRGVAVRAVKPHGALYHDASVWPEIAAAVLQGATDALGNDVMVIGPPAGALREEAARRGVPYAREGFADRRTRADGSLVPRDAPGALIVSPDEAAAQAVALASGVDTICIHADTPGAMALARAVKEALRG